MTKSLILLVLINTVKKDLLTKTCLCRKNLHRPMVLIVEAHNPVYFA